MAERFTDGQSVADMYVDLCVDMQIELNEPDHRKILAMPSTTFDMIARRIVKRRQQVPR